MDSEEKVNFLKRLQSADESTKRRWLVVLTVIIMSGVIYVWLVYFNNLVASFSQSPPPGQAEASPTITFWDAAKNSLANLYGIFMGKLRALGDVLQAPREYIIKPPR
jgi:cytoskeletal protein RodZ